MTPVHEHPQKSAVAPDSDAVWARPGTRQHKARFALLAVLFGSMEGFAGYGLVSGQFGTTEPAPTIGLIVVALGAVLFVAVLLAMMTLPKRSHNLPALAVDANGVWWVYRKHATLTAWPDLVGVGTSFKLTPYAPTGPRPCPYAFAFEAYLSDTALIDHPHQTMLRRWLVTETAPHPDLPGQRLRHVLPVAEARHRLHRMVGHHAPQLWLGETERRWSSVPGS